MVGSFFLNNWKFLLGLGLAGAAGWVLYNKFLADDGIELNYDNTMPSSTISDAEAAQKAKLLHQAMSIFGTNEALIFATLENMTYNDFVKVSRAFGLKSYDKQFGTDGGFLFGIDLGLLDWLANELSVEDLQQIQNVIPGALTR